MRSMPHHESAGHYSEEKLEGIVRTIELLREGCKRIAGRSLVIIFLLLSLFLTGCGHYYMSYSDDGSVFSRRGGTYGIGQCPSGLRRELMLLTDGRQTFSSVNGSDACRLDILEGPVKKDSLGFWDYTNNVFAILTLGIIPWHSGDKAMQVFKVTGNRIAKTIVVKSGYVTREGHLPLPFLGISDVLIMVGISCGCTLFTMNPLFLLGGPVFPFIDDGRHDFF